MEIAFDCLSALRNSFVYTDLSPSQPQFDLVASIRAAVVSSALEWKPRHVKGHADSKKPWRDLDWWEKCNVEVDKKATAFRSQLEQGKLVARNPRFFSEPYAFFIAGEKVLSLSRSLLEDEITFPQLLDWWEERGRLSRQGATDVDWEVVNKAMHARPAGMQRWCTKHCAGMCAVGTVRKARGWDGSAACPMCGRDECQINALG